MGSLLVAGWIAAVGGWHHTDTRPPSWDESLHLNLAWDYRELLLHAVPITSPWMAVYPPLYHLSLVPALSLGVPSEAKAIATHAGYAALLYGALVLLARRCQRPVEDAWLAALLTLGYAHVLHVSRHALIDFALTAWVTLGMALLFRTDRRGTGPQGPVPICLWGMVSGLGLLLKPSYAIFFVLPCLWMLGQNRHPLTFILSRQGRGIFNRYSSPLRGRGEGEGVKAFKNFALAVGVAAVISLPWYGWQGPLFLQNLMGLTGERGAAEMDPSFRTWAGWFYYIKALGPQMGIWNLAFTLAGILLAVTARWRRTRTYLETPSPLEGEGQGEGDRGRHTPHPYPPPQGGRGVFGMSSKQSPPSFPFLIAWVLSGYLVLTLLHNKDLRYTLPVLPALAFLSVMGWTELFPGKAARWSLAIVGLFLFVYNAAHVDPPRREDWKHLEVGQILQQNRDPAQPFLLASVLSNHPYFFGRTLRWSLRTHGIPLFYSSTPGKPLTDFTEVMIAKTSERGPEAERVQAQWQKLSHRGRSFEKVYPRVALLALPDGSEAVIYRRALGHRFAVGPVTKRRLEVRLEEALRQEMDGSLRVVVEGTPDDFQKGRVARARITGGPWIVRGLPIAKADIEAENLWLNLYVLWDEHRLGLMTLSSLKPALELKAADLSPVLERRIKGLQNTEVHFTGGKMRIRGRWHGVRLGATARVIVENSPRALTIVIERLKVAGAPLPGWILGKVHRQRVPLDPIPSFPVKLMVGRVTLEHDLLRVTPSPYSSPPSGGRGIR